MERIILSQNNNRIRKVNKYPANSGSKMSPETLRPKEEGPDNLFEPNPNFLFMKVHTDILSASGIRVNDTVVIDPSGTPVNDQIVIIKLENEMLLRKYQKQQNRLSFYGDSEKIAPLQIEPGYKPFSIIGIVKYVIRSMG